MAASSSGTWPRSTGSHPAWATRASSVGRLLSRICPGRSGSAPVTSSSPVEITPTRGRGWATTSATPSDASTPTAGGRHLVADAEHHARRPAGPRRRPAGGCRARPPPRCARRARRRAARSARPSRPRRRRRASGAPVKMRIASPGRSGTVGRVPGRHLGHHRQGDRSRGGVGRADGVAVHGGVGERRDRLGATTSPASTSPTASCGRDRPRRQRRAAVEDVGERLVERDHVVRGAQTMPRRRTTSARNSANSGPRSSRSSASSTVARR